MPARHGGRGDAEVGGLVCRGHHRCGVLGGPVDVADEEPAEPFARVSFVACAACGCALGDDSTDAVIFAGGTDRLLGTHRHAHHPDPAWLHIGSTGEEVDAGSDVVLTPPTPQHGVALTPTVAANVEPQHAVAVLGEHRPVLELVVAGARCPAEHDHCGTVAARHVPAGQVDTVTGGDRHVVVVEAVIAGGLFAELEVRRVRDEHCQRGRQHRPDEHPHGDRDRQQLVPPAHATQQRHSGERRQRDTGDDRGDAPDALRCRRVDRRVVWTDADSGDQPDQPEHQLRHRSGDTPSGTRDDDRSGDHDDRSTARRHHRSVDADGGGQRHTVGGDQP